MVRRPSGDWQIMDRTQISLWGFFQFGSYQLLTNWCSRGQSCQLADVTLSALGLVCLVSVNCDRVKEQV